MAFDYPDSLSLDVLQREMPERSGELSALNKIEILYEGGRRLEENVDLFLKQRSTEDEPVFNKRKTRISYENHFGDAVKEICDRFATGNLIWGEASERWEPIRENIDGKGSREKKFFVDLFREYLLSGKLFAFVETNVENPEAIENLSQLESAGATAWIRLLNMRDVLEYEEGAQGEVAWIKYRKVIREQPLVGDPVYTAKWVFVDEMAIAIYSAEVNVSKETGAILGLSSSDLGKAPLEKIVLHGRSRTPVYLLEAEPVEHVGNQCYLLAVQHLNQASSNYDAALSTNYIQRTYEKPVRDTSDLASTAESSGAPTKHGNAVVFEGKLEFSEFSGSSIKVVRGELNEVGQRIHTIVMMSGSSISRKALMQSGASKMSDRELEEISLKGYGIAIRDFYQKCLVGIAEALALDEPELKGLDRFQVALIDGLIEKLKHFSEPSVKPLVPPTLFKSLVMKIAKEMMPDASVEELNQISSEVEILVARSPSDPQPSEV